MLPQLKEKEERNLPGFWFGGEEIWNIYEQIITQHLNELLILK